MLRASLRQRQPLPSRELNSDCQISRASSPRVLFSDCNAISWHFSLLWARHLPLETVFQTRTQILEG